MIIPGIKKFKKTIQPPPDKAIMQRAVIIGALNSGIKIVNPSFCVDSLSAIECVSSLGAKIEYSGDALIIKNASINGTHSQKTRLNAGNSATSARLLLGALSGLGCSIEIFGDDSLNKRSMKNVITPLRQMGANIKANKNRCPLINIPSPLHGIIFKPAASSAQVKSAVILAALNARDATKITEPLKTRDHTERMLSYLGADIKVKGKSVTVLPGRIENKTIKIPGDISSAGFLIAAAVLTQNGYAYIKDVGLNPTRMGMVNLLKAKGASIEIEQSGEFNNEPFGNITVNSSSLRPFNISEKMLPALIDEIPVLAVMACFIKGKSVFKGLNAIKNKESDRKKEIFRYLKAFGANAELQEDTLTVFGGSPLTKKPKIKSTDHRIIMAMSVAGFVSKGCVIENPDCVNVSFPDFFTTLLN